MDAANELQHAHLCADCLRVFGSIETAADTYLERGYNPSWDVTFKEPCQLLPSIESGCKLCAMVFAQLKEAGLESAESALQVSSMGGLEARFRKALRIHYDADPDSGRRDKRVELAVYRLEGGERASVLPTQSSTGSHECFQKIEAWIRHCGEHEMCKSWQRGTGNPSSLPTRLLDVQPSNDTSYIRLVCEDTLPPVSSSYLTLSHCWGGSLPFALRSGNLNTMRQAIALTSLPRTFLDAVYVARMLHVRYLWIDALCIIQDSTDDWRAEASRMSRVYSNAYLNIAALHGSNPDAGLFKERDLATAQCIIIPSTDPRKPYRYLVHVDNANKDLEEGPLLSRAWVVQERFLCPRIVYFGKRQITWECRDRMCGECLPLFLAQSSQGFKQETLRKLVPNTLTMVADGAYFAWGKLLHSYSACNLTYGSDRLVAMQGVAQMFCTLLGLHSSDFVNGIWKSRFVDGLYWQRDHRVGIRAGTHLIKNTSNDCSWTWASSEGAVLSTYSSTASDEVQTCELLEVHGSHTASGHESQEISGWCRLRAPICKVKLSRGIGFSQDSYQGIWNYRIELDGVTFREQQHFLLFLDCHDHDWPPDDTAYDAFLMCVRSGTDKSGVIDRFECLLLQNVAQRSGCFRRIGQFEQASNPFAWEEIDPEVTDREVRSKMMPQALEEAFHAARFSEQTGSPDADGRYTITLI